MSAQVDLHSPRSRVALPADPTREGLVTRVYQFVGLQVSFCNELLPAPIIPTDEGPLSSL
jgi:hypothetical protein